MHHWPLDRPKCKMSKFLVRLNYCFQKQLRKFLNFRGSNAIQEFPAVWSYPSKLEMGQAPNI